MKPTERILSFSPYAYWRLHALYEIAICHNLQWRGHSYNYVSCDGLFSDCDMFWESTVGPRPADACATCQSQVKATLDGARIPHLPLGKFKTAETLGAARSFEKNLRDHELLDAVYRGHPVGAWVKSSVHSHLRANELDLSNAKHCAALRSYLYGGAVAIDCIGGMLDELQPTIMLLFNGRMSVTRIALELAKARGIRVVCHERGLSKETLLLWENEGCLALTPYEQLWKQWGEVPLAPAESAKVTQWLTDRAHGTNLNWKAFSVQSSLGPVAAFLDANQGRKIWTLFTSSTDEMVADRPSAFGTQYRWIEETIAFVREQPGVALVIRVHPNSGGKKSTGKNLGEIKFFETLRSTVPANVMVVMPDDSVSSYALIDRTEVGFVFGSTIALEMACRGKPVLLAAHSPWMHCASITLIDAPETYAALLTSYVKRKPRVAEAERIAIAAYRFAYAYVQRWNIPFPLVKMPDIHSGVFTVKTLAELKPGVHACLDYCAEIVLGLRPSVPVAVEPVREGAAQAELDALRSGLKTLTGQPPEAPAYRFSVVITCYNYAKFLRDCVRSVVNQTYKNFELIIVNDGSTDNSQAVAEACRREFSAVAIRVLNQPNSGQPALARNAGIRLAKGQYVLPLDADDLIGPQYLEQASQLIDTDPAVDFICANSVFDDGKTKTLARPGRFDAALMATKNQFVYCCVYRRALWEKIGGYRDNVRGCEDWDFWVAIAVAGAKPGFIPCIGLIYNQKETGVFAETVAHHAARAAQIKLNNPGAFSAASAAPAGAVNARNSSGRIIALMSAFNEGDIIYHVIGDLIANGVHVYLLDNSSTDNTVNEASRWLGRGLLKIERYPEDSAGFAERCSKEFVLRELLRRKEQLAAELDGAWFLNVDADEFRESPWPGLTLADAIRQVDALGYNAINFDLLNFRPTNDDFVPGEDVRLALPYYQPGEIFDARQIKGWKNTGGKVELASNGGHSTSFPGRRVFPLSFILRHYPIRGETHGRRKVFQERMPRFAREEVAHQWHVQYNALAEGREKFLHDPAELVRYDADRVRAELLARFSQDLLLTHTLSGATSLVGALQPGAVRGWIGRKLAMSEPLAPEIGEQAERALASLLQTVKDNKDTSALTIDAGLSRLLLAMLETKIAYARLKGDSHFAAVGTRLQRILEQQTGVAKEAPPEAPVPTPTREPAGPAPLVSVCIPTYNGAEFVAETIACALRQSYSAIEILLSDDKSTDRTVEIAEAALKASPFPVRILKHERLGLVGNWMHCVAEARGKYIKFLFQDDLLEPDCIASLVEVAERDPEIGLVFSPRRIERRSHGKTDETMDAAYRDSVDVHRAWTQLRSIQAGTTLLRDPKLLANPVNKVGEPSTVLLSKAAIEAVGGFDANLKQLVDAELWLRLMTRYKVGFVDRVLSCFRLHAKQTTQSNLKAGLIQEDWKKFFGKLATDPVFAALPAEHRSHAARMFTRLGGVLPATAPAAAVAPVADTTTFQQAIDRAQELVREGRLPEATAQFEAAARLAPDAECAARATEILTMLRAAATPAEPPPPTQEAAATDEFFDAEAVQVIQQLVATYGENPGDPARDQLVELRQGLMKFLVTAPVDQLEALFKGSFGQVFRQLLKSGLPSEPPTEEISAQVAVLDEAMAEGQGAAQFDCRPLLARMLCAPAHRGLAQIAPEQIPAWLLDDYLAHVFHAPLVFVMSGEAERYHDHMLAWARAVHQRTRTAPNDKLTGSVAFFFAMKVSHIPSYFSARNTRELAEKRAAIMEFVLVKNGANIDAKFPRRPANRPRIKVGFLNHHFGEQTETHVAMPTLQLDRTRFEVCLFTLVARGGAIEERCRSFSDSFTLLPQNVHEQVRTIRAAALDVIVIGTNVTAVTNPVSLLALHRLAPLQLVNYCSPVSTGMRHVDGYLTGRLNHVAGMQEHFSEKLQLCEGGPGCLDYTVEAAGSAKFDRAALGIAPDEVVFVNAAACFKILPEMQETWAKILAAVPRSRLLLLPFNPNWANSFPVKQFERTLVDACARHGVGRDRLIFASSLPSRADVKALEAIADIYLDTAPFSGSISVIDPLELGIPTVVWEGATHRSRMASALIRELGVPELITPDEAAYVALSVRIATDAEYRRALNERIRAAIARRPKFINPEAYAAELGDLLESLVLPKGKPESRATANRREREVASI